MPPLVDPPLVDPPLVDPLLLDFALPACSGAAACSSRESLPSPFLSSLAKSLSCGVPFASSFEMKPSLFLSRALNIASAPPSSFVAPPEALSLDEALLLDEELAADLSLPADAPVEALSSAPAARGQAKAAATAAAIRVFNVMAISFEVNSWLIRLARLIAARSVLQNACRSAEGTTRCRGGVASRCASGRAASRLRRRGRTPFCRRA